MSMGFTIRQDYLDGTTIQQNGKTFCKVFADAGLALDEKASREQSYQRAVQVVTALEAYYGNE